MKPAFPAAVAVLLSLALELIGLQSPCLATIRYVSPNGGGTGLWTNATKLDVALAAAQSGDEIWCLGGLYKVPGANRARSFAVPSGVTVYGSFIATDTSLADRNARIPLADAYVPWPRTPNWDPSTVLSGVLAGGNGVVRAYHVVSATGTSNSLVKGAGLDGGVKLDGVWIEAGNANGSTLSVDDVGGGILVYDNPNTITAGTLTVVNSRVSDNMAFQGGGGIYAQSVAVVFNNSLLQINGTSSPAITVEGGGILAITDASLVMDKSAVIGNQAQSFGGGLFADSTTPVELSNTWFEGNATFPVYTAGYITSNGAGMLVYSTATVTNCKFVNNWAFYDYAHGGNSRGGAINSVGGPLRITDTYFKGNCAFNGGAVYASGGGNAASVVRCTFEKNGYYELDTTPPQAPGTFRGGAVFDNGGFFAFDCDFIENRSYMQGGAIWGPIADIMNCLFKKNKAIYSTLAGWDTSPSSFSDGQPAAGGAIYVLQNSPRFVNCIFEANDAEKQGGAVWCRSGYPKFYHCTLARNAAHTNPGCGGVYSYSASVYLANSVLWGNSDASGDTTRGDQLFVAVGGGGSITTEYCCVRGALPNPNIGNINSNPLFVDLTNFDLHLGNGSPCINVGNNCLVPGRSCGGQPPLVDPLDWELDGDTEELPQDYDFQTRIRNSIVDMGAYEK